jgi:hypothetical protein
VGPWSEQLRARRGRSIAAVVGVVVVLFVVLAASSGGGEDADPRVLEAGQVDIQLPPGFKVVNDTVVAPRASAPQSSTATAPANAAPSAAGDVSTTSTTAAGSVPLDNASDPTSDLLIAFGKFRDCLGDLGVKFIGAPDGSNPESPTNDPAYLEALGTCAARSNIVQALQAAQSAEENLTPAQIKERNKGYLRWRDCMIKRGWDIPKPTPDSQGRLFSFTGGSGPELNPPAGKDVFTSKDIEQCATRVQRATQGNN